MGAPDRQAARELAKFAPTRLERALSKVAPKTAQRMLHSRMKFEMTASIGRGIGGYVGARRDRAQTAGWGTGVAGSPQSDISPDLPMLRDRSRDQMRNAPVALGALNTDVLHVVGSGLSCTPAIDFKRLGITEEAAQEWIDDHKARFNDWAGSPDCDVRRQLDFYSMQELAYRSWGESGDCFVLTPIVERDGENRLALQLIEADRVCNPLGVRDSNTLQDGVRLDAETGAPIAIHVARNHPGDLRGTANVWTEVQIRDQATGRRNVLHLFDTLRPGQVRGVPWIAAIIEILKQLGKWSDAELNAAVTTSIWAVFMEMDPDAFIDLFDDNDRTNIVNNAQKWSGSMESGKAVNLLPGERANMVAPGRPNPLFDPFWTAMVRQIGMALGMPYEVLVMHFQSSYTAARGALLMAWRRFYQRREKLAKMKCQPVYELWLANEVAEGRSACPGFFASKRIRAAWCASVWTGDGPGSVDPVKEVTAAKMRIEIEQSTMEAESMAYDGKDWDAKHRQRAKEVAAVKRDGTGAAPMPGQLAVPGAQPDPGDDDDGSDDDSETPPAPAPAPAPAPPAPAPTPPRVARAAQPPAKKR